jgi:peptidoglycan/LPS O-acetylase OafA/YrhL
MAAQRELILLVAGPRLPTVWVTLAGASVAWRLWTRFAAQSIEASYAWSPANLEAFAAGALVAWLLRHERRSLAVWAPRVAIAAGMCVAMLWTRLGHFNFWSAPVEVLTLGTSAVVALFATTIGVSVTGATSSVLNRAFSSSWLCACGKYSYAIYLFHSPVMELLRPLRGASDTLLPSIILAASVAIGSLAAAFVSWHVWEAPFLGLKRYFPSRGRLVSAQPDSMTSEALNSSLSSDHRRVA